SSEVSDSSGATRICRPSAEQLTRYGRAWEMAAPRASASRPAAVSAPARVRLFDHMPITDGTSTAPRMSTTAITSISSSTVNARRRRAASTGTPRWCGRSGLLLAVSYLFQLLRRADRLIPTRLHGVNERPHRVRFAGVLHILDLVLILPPRVEHR